MRYTNTSNPLFSINTTSVFDPIDSTSSLRSQSLNYGDPSTLGATSVSEATSSSSLHTTLSSTPFGHSTSTSTTSTRDAIGNYVAAGLGLSTSTAGTSTSSNSGPSNHTISHASVSIYHSSLASSAHSRAFHTNLTTESLPLSHPGPLSPGASTSHSSSNKTNRLTDTTNATLTAVGTGATTIFNNATQSNLTLSGDCWEQWSEYWDYSTSEAGFRVLVTTKTSPGVVEFSTSTTWTTLTEEDSLTTTEALWDWIDVGTTTEIWTIKTYTTVSEQPSSLRPIITTPGCTLPSSVPQCQSQWDSYIASDFSTEIMLENQPPTPACQQANVGPSACDNYITNYLDAFEMFGNNENFGFLTTYVNSSSSWPSTMSFAPGCTLGCYSCAITGKTVQLMYWPASTASLPSNFSVTRNLTSAPAIIGEPVTTVIQSKLDLQVSAFFEVQD